MFSPYCLEHPSDNTSSVLYTWQLFFTPKIVLDGVVLGNRLFSAQEQMLERVLQASWSDHPSLAVASSMCTRLYMASSDTENKIGGSCVDNSQPPTTTAAVSEFSLRTQRVVIYPSTAIVRRCRAGYVSRTTFSFLRLEYLAFFS